MSRAEWMKPTKFEDGSNEFSTKLNRRMLMAYFKGMILEDDSMKGSLVDKKSRVFK